MEIDTDIVAEELAHAVPELSKRGLYRASLWASELSISMAESASASSASSASSKEPLLRATSGADVPSHIQSVIWTAKSYLDLRQYLRGSSNSPAGLKL